MELVGDVELPNAKRETGPLHGNHIELLQNKRDELLILEEGLKPRIVQIL